MPEGSLATCQPRCFAAGPNGGWLAGSHRYRIGPDPTEVVVRRAIDQAGTEDLAELFTGFFSAPMSEAVPVVPDGGVMRFLVEILSVTVIGTRLEPGSIGPSR